MFANVKFRDAFCFQAPGIAPQILATGSIAGSSMPVVASLATSAGPAGNYNNFKKWVFIVQTGSAAATSLFNAWVAGGSTSGTGASIMLPSTSTSTFSGSGTYGISTQFGSYATMVMEVRGEYLTGCGSVINWIRPVLSVTNASAVAACLSLAFLGGGEQASLYDVNTGWCLQETDAF